MTRGRPLIIAHRGASGYLPEHTLEAKALAYGLGADFLEQDLVASRDDELVVLHDIHLDRVTDVARRFPDRARADGRYYARDFDLAELRQLEVHERRTADGISAVFPRRFPTATGRFRIATLREELDLIRGLNRSTGRDVGIYPEVKRPAWHRREGVDLFAILLPVLAAYGYRRDDTVWLQCFDAAELRRVRRELGADFNQLQLLEARAGGEPPAGPRMEEIASYAEGIGPALSQLYTLPGIDGRPVSSGLAGAAHAAGLAVHAYTFRADEPLPGFGDFDETVRWFVGELGIDGLFTDFPDRARAALP